jgi:geranylgeranyl diphosphate synthase type II
VLVGDALIFAAFETLARANAPADALLALARAGGAASGLVAGQAWELEPAKVRVSVYHAQKTGALFELACRLGASTAGVDPEPFAAFGARLGAVYQMADDLLDVVGDPAQCGKPTGQDARAQRPSAVNLAGSVSTAKERLRLAVEQLRSAVPGCVRPEVVASLLDRAVVPLVSRLRIPENPPRIARAG